MEFCMLLMLSNGKEIWGFVPPLIAGKLPTMVNPGLNKDQVVEQFQFLV